MKVYIVNHYNWDEHWVVAVYTTRELAERHVENDRREAFEREGRKAHRRATGFRWSKDRDNVFMERQPDGTVMVSPNMAKGEPIGFEDIPAETYEEFVKRRDDGLEIDEQEVLA